MVKRLSSIHDIYQSIMEFGKQEKDAAGSPQDEKEMLKKLREATIELIKEIRILQFSDEDEE